MSLRVVRDIRRDNRQQSLELQADIERLTAEIENLTAEKRSEGWKEPYLVMTRNQGAAETGEGSYRQGQTDCRITKAAHRDSKAV